MDPFEYMHALAQLWGRGAKDFAAAQQGMWSMITYMQNRYYSSASRYTTSAFTRLKLGAGLAERNLAPRVFETWSEAQAFSAAHTRS